MKFSLSYSDVGASVMMTPEDEEDTRISDEDGDGGCTESCEMVTA